MMWDIKQTKRFARLYKKLHDNMVVDVDDAIEKIQKILKLVIVKWGI